MQFLFGDYVLDTDRRELRRGSELVSTGPQVFDLLLYLVQNRERVVSKDDLFEVIWAGRVVSESTLTTHINAVRKAVGDSGEVQNLIRTVPRRGFRFVGEVTEDQAQNGKDTVKAAPIAPKLERAEIERAKRKPTASLDALRHWQFGVVALLIVVIAAGGVAWWQPWVERVDPASLDRMALPLPDKPSIAVLPFANLSGNPAQDVLSDGLSENITTALSRIPDIFVIARTSVLVYKGKPAKVQRVAEDLGVRYVLEGSVQRSGDKVRVTAQLIDALKGNHLWAMGYDRKVKDALALQDEITLSVLNALEVKLTDDRMRGLRSNTKNLQAYQHLQRGFRIFFRFTKADNAEARRLFERAVELDPNYGAAWNQLG